MNSLLKNRFHLIWELIKLYYLWFHLLFPNQFSLVVEINK